MDPEGLRQPFNFHLGVGRQVDEHGASQFVQNWFEVTLDLPLTLAKDQSKVVGIDMNVENWFQDPHIYDHNEYGGRIMDNQEAMRKGSENGRQGVFAISSIGPYP